MPSFSLQSVEQKVFRKSIDHGWWDLYLGLLLLLIGVSAVLDDLGKGEYDLWLMAGAVILFFIGYRFVIEPRLGRVRFGPRRKARLGVVAAIIGAAVLVGLALWFLSSSRIISTDLLPTILFGVISLGGFGLAAYLLQFQRLYLYGFLYAAGFLCLELIRIKVVRSIPVISGGLVILIIGIFYFTRFLATSPVPSVPEEDVHDHNA